MSRVVSRDAAGSDRDPPDGSPDRDALPGDESPYADRIVALAERARRDRSAFEPPDELPDEERALSYLTDGVGPALLVYVEAHTGEGHARFAEWELVELDRALNEWFALYARCYGVDLDAAFSVREAAELLIETRDLRDVAQLLTHVPPRS